LRPLLEELCKQTKDGSLMPLQLLQIKLQQTKKSARCQRAMTSKKRTSKPEEQTYKCKH